MNEVGTDELREWFREWLAANADRLIPYREPEPASYEEADELHVGLLLLLAEAGWSLIGWPESIGGLGGNLVLRGVVYDELAAAGYVLPERCYPVEILGPTLLRYAPDLAVSYLPGLITGAEMWCQGFSEPEAGSDLASLRCRATERPGGWVVNGQKLWTSNAQMSTKCVLLVRTGTPESRHRGLTMLLVDMNTPGITVNPIRSAAGANHLCEVFLDDVEVPADRLIGEVGKGWEVAMYLLQFERGMYAWMRQAVLHHRVELVRHQMPGPPGDLEAAVLGEMYAAVSTLRARTASTLSRLAAGARLGPEASIDKLLLSRAEQCVTDGARRLLHPAVETGSGEWAAYWRSAWYFARAATILGGVAEVQRSIVAQQLLGLPR
ncbi:acyl-CoA dehydrogenase family protein [Sporichthya brevicatena]|uniref:acyl-CoA dehydrogenase family protein n=1 Tax=Sporichthya brevicatena TaxID=171442 RepID=UPI0031D4C92B